MRVVAVVVAALAQLLPLAYALSVSGDFGRQAQTIAESVAASVVIASIGAGILGGLGARRSLAVVQGAPSALVSAVITIAFIPAGVYGVLSFGVAGILFVVVPAAVTGLSLAAPILGNAAGARLRANRP
ncbi:MAG TPA: hypothetical protein VFR33_13990 [Candidatus Dormibacteraeota bacterium]|nr:hypothetical protein [Candidatus Dormibacteraeota bacterium]